MKKQRTIRGVTIETRKATFQNFNALTVEVGTNGTQGGDSGYGCRTYISFMGDEMTDMSVRTPRRKDLDRKKVELSFGGDAELDTLIHALEFTVKNLKEMQGGKPEIDTTADEESENFKLRFFKNNDKTAIIAEEEIYSSLEDAKEMAQNFLKYWKSGCQNADFCCIYSEEGTLISIVEKEK